MALEDVTSDAEEDAKEELTEDIKTELGIEDKETLEKVDDRLRDATQFAVDLDKRIQDLEDRLNKIEDGIQINRGAILALFREIGNPENAEIEKVAKEEESKNPWMTGDN